MRRIDRPIVCLLLALPVLVAGCASSTPGPGEFPDYNVVRLYNDSPGEIFDIQLSAGATVTVLEHLPPDHSPVSDRGVSPDPATATVSWRTGDGRRFEKEVAIAKEVPAGFRGVILLRLTETGDVALRLIPYRELR